ALDLDDVLNSCTMYLLHVLGCDVGPFDYDKFPDVGYDMVGAWATLTSRPKVDVGVFWEWISRRIWEDMPTSEQFWLLHTAEKLVGQENVLIATSPTKSPDCLFGKYQWIERHTPDWCHRQYSITPRKSWLAQPGVLLIDDCDANCNAFRDGGGDAILVPRPWNTLEGFCDDVDGYLVDELGRREWDSPST
ncbi:unnamed protein product, partial [marine sediment metagenome]